MSSFSSLGPIRGTAPALSSLPARPSSWPLGSRHSGKIWPWSSIGRATSTLRKLLQQSRDLDVAALAGQQGAPELWREGAQRLAGIVRELDELDKAQT